MTELLEAVVSWQSLLGVLAVFGFLPGFVLRIVVRLYPPDDPRRQELVAELYVMPRINRPVWVAQQIETALFEGPPARGEARRLRDLERRRQRNEERLARQRRRRIRQLARKGRKRESAFSPVQRLRLTLVLFISVMTVTLVTVVLSHQPSPSVELSGPTTAMSLAAVVIAFITVIQVIRSETRDHRAREAFRRHARVRAAGSVSVSSRSDVRLIRE